MFKPQSDQTALTLVFIEKMPCWLHVAWTYNVCVKYWKTKTFSQEVDYRDKTNEDNKLNSEILNFWKNLYARFTRTLKPISRLTKNLLLTHVFQDLQMEFLARFWFDKIRRYGRLWQHIIILTTSMCLPRPMKSPDRLNTRADDLWNDQVRHLHLEPFIKQS